METQWLPVSLVVWITALAGTLDARQQVRFVALCTGLLFARGRRTVASWLRLLRGRDYKRYYYLLGSVGRKALAIAGVLLRILLKRLPGDGPGTPLVFAIDDSPTKRYGPHVEGAGKHHNPTPGPAGSPFLYGHVWVCLARLVRHSLWGAIALPILSHLYIRAEDVGWMAAYYGWQFHTKLELAAAQIEWLVQQLGPDHPPIWVVTDGAYVKRPFLSGCWVRGVTVIESAAVRCGLVVVAAGGRSRPERSWPAAEVRQGPGSTWPDARAYPGRLTGLFSPHGRLVVKKYKTFLATYKPVGGVIRVVLVRGARSLGGVLLDRPGSERGIDPRDGGRPLWRCSRSSTTSRRFMERDSNISPCAGNVAGVEPDRSVAHAGGAVGLGTIAAPGC